MLFEPYFFVLILQLFRTIKTLYVFFLQYKQVPEEFIEHYELKLNRHCEKKNYQKQCRLLSQSNSLRSLFSPYYTKRSSFEIMLRLACKETAYIVAQLNLAVFNSSYLIFVCLSSLAASTVKNTSFKRQRGSYADWNQANLVWTHQTMWDFPSELDKCFVGLIAEVWSHSITSSITPSP